MRTWEIWVSKKGILYVLYLDETVYLYIYIRIPVVPHKAVAEVSKIGNYRRD